MIRTFLSVLVFAVLAAGQTPQSILPADLQSHFTLSGLPAENQTIVAVEDQHFGWAWRLHTPANDETDVWKYSLKGKGETAVDEGDLLLVQFWIRTPNSGESALVRFICQVDSDPFDKSVSWTALAGEEWSKVEIPFQMAGSYGPGEWSVQFWITYPEQTLEIGDLSVINHGAGKSWRDFNLSTYPYQGRAADAEWRKTAAERIERYRKTDIAVVVRDEAGNPVPDAAVRVALKTQAFRFGSAVSASRINDPWQTAYQDALLQSFNSVTIRNALKWRQWENDRTSGIQAVDWARAQGLSVRGHNVVWPGWNHLPDSLQALQEDPEALRQTVRDHVTDVTTATSGRLNDWDVVNEAYTNRDLQEILGETEIAEWFRLTRLADPDVRLFVNDFGIISGGGWDIAHRQGYHGMIEMLQSAGASLEGIGLQGHFNNGQLTGIDRSLEIFDEFGSYGKALLITEFTYDTDDEELQAEYTRDFLTAAFSHPAVKGFYNWNFWEDDGRRPNAAMYRADGSMKPSGEVWYELVGKNWQTDVEGFTDAEGVFRTRGFLGEYDVTVRQDGASVTSPLLVMDHEAPAYSMTGEQEAGSFRPDGILNGASFRDGSLAPGQIVTIYGEGFGSPGLEQADDVDGQLPTYVGETRVLFDGQPAAMVYSLRGQVSAIVPFGVSERTTIEIEYLGVRTPPVSLSVVPAAPAIFCYAGGRGQALAVNDSTTFNRKETPVGQDGILTFFLTGAGRVSPSIGDGLKPKAPDFPAPVQRLKVYIAGQRAEVLFAGLVYAGVTQVNIRIPPGVLTGPTIPLWVEVGDTSSRDDVFIAIE